MMKDGAAGPTGDSGSSIGDDQAAGGELSGRRQRSPMVESYPEVATVQRGPAAAGLSSSPTSTPVTVDEIQNGKAPPCGGLVSTVGGEQTAGGERETVGDGFSARPVFPMATQVAATGGSNGGSRAPLDASITAVGVGQSVSRPTVATARVSSSPASMRTGVVADSPAPAPTKAAVDSVSSMAASPKGSHVVGTINPNPNIAGPP